MPDDDRRPPISPTMALRVAGFGVVAFILFGIIFFRLWYLQVLDGDQYVAQARQNQVRTERIAAPRGEIVDRSGLALVTNRRATVLSIDPQHVAASTRSAINGWGQAMGRRALRPKGHRGAPIPMPAADPALARLERSLGRVLRMKAATIHERLVAELVQVPYADVRIKTDVDATQRNYIEEHRERFPGVKVDQVFLRKYPYGRAAAQLLGYTGEINTDELRSKAYTGIAPGTVIGQAGIEATYDQYLRGTDGAYRISVNALGERRGAVTAREPRAGRQVKLTLDLGLQQAGQKAFGAIAGSLQGGFVAMNPETGGIYALGSFPDYDPKDLARPMTTEQYEREFGESAGSPLYNRIISGGYAVGSTFKIATALAGLDTGQITTTSQFNDTGCLRVGKLATDVRCNARKQAHGVVDLRKAIAVSSDAYFYQLGVDLNPLPGTPLQTWARRLGIGRATGIDLPQESTGVVPDAAWREERNKAELTCRKERKVSSCGLSDMRGWQGGDEVNLAIGQGDLQASPLQMAVAYATLANGGKRVVPHLGAQVQDSDGRFVQKLEPAAAKKIKIDASWRGTLMGGLADATTVQGGTSADVFADWPHDRYPIFGKTGTVQRNGEQDSSFFVAYAYDAQRPERNPIVIACIIEKGGFGATSAAPTVGRMLAKWFNVKDVQFARGASTDA